MIKDIKELNFPKYATLETATVTIADMGDRTITSQVKIDGDVVPDFSYDWEVEFKGERYIHPVRTPQGTKDNTSRRSKVDLVFHHWAIYEMKRHYFVEMASTSAGTAIADKYIALLGLNLEDFVTAFNLVLNHYFGGRIIIKLNPNPVQPYNTEAKFVSISYSYIWDVLQQMHDIYGVRWTLKTNAEGVCEILMGYPAEEVSHIFEYGFEGGLLSVQRQVQSTDIRNRLLGRGGSKNLPYRYFKDKDPNNPLFEADPDWIPELANIAFTELRGKTFRDYVKGWKAKHYSGTAMAEPTEAYLAGYNAEKFDPIEYVDDKESIEKYGVLVGALENNEEIYPSIQGAPGDVDIIVDAEQVTDDDVDAAVENDAVETNIEGMSFTKTGVKTGEEVSIKVSARNAKVYFSVPEGKKGTINTPSYTAKGKYGDRGNVQSVPDGLITVYSDKCSFTVHEKSTGEQVSRLNIPPGEYYYEAMVVASHAHTGDINLTASVSAIHLIISTDTDSGWHQTFNIWVRNIWGSSRNAGETDQQYADRVWAPILGDRLGNEARVVFASGWLSFSSDWEFPIVGYAFDDSKDGSEWMLTLAKSEAELEASGKYIPYEGYNASAGDRFFFIGIDMPYQYVLWAEERLDDYKRDGLLDTAHINPTWVIKTDKVRLNQDREGAVLVDSLNAGSQIRLASKQFISGAYESLYVQSMTYNWTADTILYPDVEVVVSDKVSTVKNPVAQIQSNIESIQRQVGSLSNIQQIVRQVCDQLYLRKDGVEDLSKSPTRFLGKVTGEKFRQGQIGGRDWGIYRDENGNAILEADKIVARQGILVSDLVVNEATYVGGLQINSAAAMKVTAVEESEDGYICYFDQQQGSVTNKFKVDDVALCQKFDPEDNEVKFYKRRVVAVAETSVTLSKTDVNGDGIPAVDDEIIHYGNYTDKTRQFVIIRDVIGGGYERMLMGLDSVTSDGVEYYFAGKSADSKARWFVGDSEQYAKYENGQLTIKGNLLVTGSDKPITDQIAELDYIKNAFGDGTQGLILGTAIIVGYNDDQGNFVPMAGMSGIFDKDSENGGPAAWYGGTTENAKSMIFMDGTGYFADGLFSWDKEKGINLGKGQIKINYDGSVDFGGDIRIGGTGDETLDSLLTIVAGLTKMWYLDDDGNVCTNHNVIIAGDTSSGGEGEDTPSAGLDEEQLQAYLDLHKYVTEDDIAGLIPDVDLSGYYTSAQTDSAISTAIADLINGAPTTLDTLKEIADALAENEGVVEALNTAIGTKANALDVYTMSQIDAKFENYETSLSTKADKATTLAGYGITNAYTKTDIDSKVTAINNSISGVSGRVTTLETWKSDIAKYITIVDGNVKISTNLIVTGDTSSGGSGEDTGAEGTVTGIKVSTTETLTPNSAGVIDMVSTLASIDVSDQLTAYAKTEDVNAALLTKQDTISDLATIRSGAALGATALQSITKSMVDSVLGGTSNSNANKFLMCTGSTTVWNTITASTVGLGNVTNLAASGYLTALSSSTTNAVSITVGGTTKTITAATMKSSLGLGSNAYTSTAYLPLAGGTLQGDSADLLVINRLSSTSSTYITLRGNGSLRGRIGFDANNNPIVQDLNYGTDNHTLIHSGNIGSQSVNYATSAGNANTLEGYGLSSISYIRYLFSKSDYQHYVVLLCKVGTNTTNTYHRITGKLYTSNRGTSRYQAADIDVFVSNWESGNDKYYRFDTYGLGVNMRLITCTYGGSTYLAIEHTSIQAVNLYFEGTRANMDLTAVHYYTSNPETVVNSEINDSRAAVSLSQPYSGSYKYALTSDNVASATKLATARTIWGQSFDGTGNVSGALKTPSGYNAVTILDSYLVLGQGMAENSLPTYLDGYNVYMRYGKSSTIGLTLNSSGNVGIGTTSPAYMLDVAGTGRFTGAVTMSSTLSVGGSVSTPALYGGTSDSYNWRLVSDVSTNAIWLQARLADKTSNNGILYLSGINAEPLTILHLIATETTARILRPSSNSSYTLGTSSYQWSTIYGVNGVFSGDTSSGSDIRFKDVIKNKTIKIEHIAKAPLFTFKWNDRDDDTIHLGSSAQYWENICPWLVTGEDFKSLNYATLGVAIGISLAKKAVNHEERIKELEKENKELKETIRRIQYGS